MPIEYDEKTGNRSISGTEYYQHDELHRALVKGEPVGALLEAISPEYRKAMLDFPRSYVTSDLSNIDLWTAVHAAAKGGNVENLKLLAAAGADFSVTTRNYGRTPLHVGAEYDRSEAIEYLIKQQHFAPDVPTLETNYYAYGAGRTALMEAAVHGALAAAKTLLLAGANPNHQSVYEKRTPLQDACEYGFGWSKADTVIEMIKLLVAHSADPDIKPEKRYGYLNISATEYLVSSKENRANVKAIFDQKREEKQFNPDVKVDMSEFPLLMFNANKPGQGTTAPDNQATVIPEQSKMQPN